MKQRKIIKYRIISNVQLHLKLFETDKSFMTHSISKSVSKNYKERKNMRECICWNMINHIFIFRYHILDSLRHPLLQVHVCVVWTDKNATRMYERSQDFFKIILEISIN